VKKKFNIIKVHGTTIKICALFFFPQHPGKNRWRAPETGYWNKTDLGLTRPNDLEKQSVLKPFSGLKAHSDNCRLISLIKFHSHFVVNVIFY
jgi:hypothetical protein